MDFVPQASAESRRQTETARQQSRARMRGPQSRQSLARVRGPAGSAVHDCLESTPARLGVAADFAVLRGHLVTSVFPRMAPDTNRSEPSQPAVACPDS